MQRIVGRGLCQMALGRAGVAGEIGALSSLKEGANGAGWCMRLFSSTSDDGTHDDFKPQYKGDAPASVAEMIEKDVKEHPIFVFMKGHPEAPMCGFSNMVCRILDAYQVQYGSRDVLADPELREGIKMYTHWPTIPQVFINGEFVGGCDIMIQMHQNGELKTELDKATEKKN